MTDVVDELDPSEFLSAEELAALQAEGAGEGEDVADEIDLSEFMTPEELAKIKEMEAKDGFVEGEGDAVDEIDLSEFLSPEELAALEEEELERQARAEIEAELAAADDEVVDELDPSDFLSPEELAALEEAGKSAVTDEDIEAMRDLGMSEAEIQAYIAAQSKPKKSEAVNKTESAVSEEDIAAMRDLGMSEAEIQAYIDTQTKRTKDPKESAAKSEGGVSAEDIEAMRDLGMSEAEIQAYIAAQSKPKTSASANKSESDAAVSEEDIAAMRDMGMSEAEIQAYIDTQTKRKKRAETKDAVAAQNGVSAEDIAAMRDLGMSEEEIAKYIEAQSKPKQKRARPVGPPPVNKDGTVDFRAMMKKRSGPASSDRSGGDDKPAFGIGMLKKRGGPPGDNGKGNDGEAQPAFGLGMLRATGKRPLVDTTREEQEAMPGGFGIALKKTGSKLNEEPSPAENPSGSLFDWNALGLGDWQPPEDFQNSYLLELKEQREAEAAAATAAEGGDKKKGGDKKPAAKPPPPPGPGGPPPPPPKAPTAADLERLANAKAAGPGGPPPPPPPPTNEQLAARSAGAPEPPPPPPSSGSALDALMAKRAATQSSAPPAPPPPPATPPVPLSAAPPPPPSTPPVPLAAAPPPPATPPVPLAAVPPPPAKPPVPLADAVPPPPATPPVPLAAAVPPPPAKPPVPLAAAVPPPPTVAPVPLAAAPPPPVTPPEPLATPAPAPAPAPLPELAPLPVYRELTEEERDRLAEQEWAALEAKSLAYAREKRLKMEEEERLAKIARGEDPDKKPTSDDDDDEDSLLSREERKTYHGTRTRDSAPSVRAAPEEEAGNAEEELEASLAAWSAARGASDASTFSAGMVALLELGEPSLGELLAQDDTLLLVRYRLDDFPDIARLLTSQDALYDLVDYLTVPVPEPAPGESEPEAQEQRRLRYPAMACELLASKVAALDDALLQDTLLVQRLLDFFRAPRGELSLLLAPGVVRVLASLLEWRASVLLPQIQDASSWLPALLAHVHVDAVHSLLAAVAKCDGGEAWLVQEQLAKQLAALIVAAEENAGDAAAREQSRGAVHVVHELVLACAADGALVSALSTEALAALPSLAFAAPPLSVHAARDALEVLSKLVRAFGVHVERNPGAVAWAVSALDAVPPLLSALLTGEHLDALGDVLSAPAEHDRCNAAGKTHPVFGVQRYAALQLLHALVELKWPAVLEAVVVRGNAALLAAVNLFLDYEQCNMAHDAVASTFVALLTHAPRDVLVPLVEDTHLVDKLVEAQRLWNAERQVERHAPPYLPYLHLIGHRLVASAAFHAELAAHCETHSEWGMLKEELSKLREAQRRLELDEIAPLPADYPLEPKSHDSFTSGDEDAPMPTTPRVALQPLAADETLAADAAALLDSVEGDAALEALMGDDLDYMLQGVVTDPALLAASEAALAAAPAPSRVTDAIDSILNGALDARVQSADLKTLSLDDILNM